MRVANGGHGLIQGGGSLPPSVLGLRAIPCQVTGDGIRVGGQGRDVVLVAPRQEARELETIPMMSIARQRRALEHERDLLVAVGALGNEPASVDGQFSRWLVPGRCGRR